MEDAERFKDCIRLECVCLVCSKISPFFGLVVEAGGNTAHNCPSCNAAFFGRCYSSSYAADIANIRIFMYFTIMVNIESRHSLMTSTISLSSTPQRCEGYVLLL
jgi:hypothetical protein